MASGEFRYSIDTSALLEAFIRRYPPDIAPKMWDEWLPKLIEDEPLFAAYDVLEDLSVRDDDIFKWAKSYDKMFVEIDRYEPELSQIMVDYPRLVDTRRNKSGSDPMVIAFAQAQALTVVSHEMGGSQNSPNIPFVCGKLDIRHINLLNLIREEGWVF